MNNLSTVKRFSPKLTRTLEALQLSGVFPAMMFGRVFDEDSLDARSCVAAEPAANNTVKLIRLTFCLLCENRIHSMKKKLKGCVLFSQRLGCRARRPAARRSAFMRFNCCQCVSLKATTDQREREKSPIPCHSHRGPDAGSSGHEHRELHTQRQ